MTTRRAAERGATLFVVVLTVTLLTGVGLYTVHSASLSARAAGNGREALQAQRITEVNALALLLTLRIDARPYIQEALNANPGHCEMNKDLPAGVPCLQITSDGLLPPSGASLFGTDSFGPLGTLTGKARVEITDVHDLQTPMPGHDANKEDLRFYHVSVTTIGSLSPADVSGANACVDNVMQVTGQHLTRAHMILGPTPQVVRQADL